MAILLLAVMLLVHVVKALHTHSYSTGHSHGRESLLTKAAHVHETCSICEFHFAKDTALSCKPILVIAPVYAAPSYSRLITAINPNLLSINEGRGPPQV